MPHSFRASFRFVLAAAPALLLSLTARAVPFITQLTLPAIGTYDHSLVLRFAAVFSEPVIVEGTPRLPLKIGGVTRYASPVVPLEEPAASRVLAFEFVPDADPAADGVVLGSTLDLNGGSVRGLDRSAATLTLPAADTRGIRLATLPPPAPHILRVLADAEGRPIRGGGDTLLLQGTADGGSRVILRREDIGEIGAVTAAPNGAWLFAYPRNAITAGAFRFTATATNAAGLTSDRSVPFDLTVSLAPPADL